jgi:hypothetical protein
VPTQSAAFDATTRRVHVVVRYAFRALLFSVCFLHCLYIHEGVWMKRLIPCGRFRGLMSARALSVGYARKNGTNVETDTGIRG